MNLPKYSNCVLDMRFFLGSLRDYSGNGNSGIGTGIYFQKKPDKHVIFSGTDKITVADSAELQTLEGTIIAYGDFNDRVANDRIYNKRDVGGTHIDWYFSSDTAVGIYDGTATTTAALNWAGAKSVAISYINGSKTKGYVDGAFITDFTAAIALSANDAPVTIGNYYTGDSPNYNPFKGILQWDVQLTDEEIAQVHKWIMLTRTPSYPKKNFVYPSQIVNGKDTKYGSDTVTNGDFDAWTAGAPDDWTVTGDDATNTITEDADGITMVGDGAALGVYQTAMTVGKRYIVTVDVAAITGTFKMDVGATMVVNSTGVTTFDITTTESIIYIHRNSGAWSATVKSLRVQEVKETVAAYDMKNVHGSIIDKTGNGNDGTIDGCVQEKGIGGLPSMKFQDGNEIDFGSGAGMLETDDVSFSVATLAVGGSAGAERSILSKQTSVGASGTGWGLSTTSGGIFASYFYDGGGNRTLVTAGGLGSGGYDRVVFVYDNTLATISLYINGVLADSAGSISGFTAAAAQSLVAGRLSYTPAWLNDGKLSETEFFNYGLSQAEVSADYNKYAQMPTFLDDLKDANESIAAEGGAIGTQLSNTNWKFGDTSARYKISRDSIDGMVGGDEKVVGGMLYTSWAATQDATLSNPETGVLRVAFGTLTNPQARQSILTIGKKYRVTGWARSDGFKNPRVLSADASIDWLGTTSTDWQRIDVIATTTNISFDLRCVTGVAGYSEFKEISVKEIDDNDKVIECTTAGILYQESKQAYGTWEWSAKKTSATSIMRTYLTSDNATSVNTTYTLEISATEQIRLVERTAGGDTGKMASAVAYVDIDTWYKFRVTRRYDGQFTIYIKGGDFKVWTIVVASTGTPGTNPFIDNTITTSNFVSLDYDVGDKISGFRFTSGVLTP